MSDNKNKTKILAICPICKKRFRNEGRHIVIQFLLPTPPEDQQKMTYPLFLCTTCGVYFHPFTVLDELKKRLQGEGLQTTQAPANVKQVK